MKRFLGTGIITLVLILALVACGENKDQQANQTTPEPGKDSQATPPVETPEDVVHGIELPGRLLFVKSGEIWMWAGTEAHHLMGAGSFWQPAWSPDGTHIAFVERGMSYSNVLVADEHGNKAEQITYNESALPIQSHERIYDTMWAFYPAWSPDSNYITIVSQEGPPIGSPAAEYTLGLYQIPLNGEPRQELYVNLEVHVGPMIYPPIPTPGLVEPRYLIYTHTYIRPDSTPQIYRLNLQEGISQPFPGVPPHSYDPAFAPNSKWLAFAAKRQEYTDIFVTLGNPSDETIPEPTQITDLGTARSPAFSPDGKKLAFLAIPPNQSGFELWVTDVQVDDEGNFQAGEPSQVTEGMRLDADSGLSWAP